MGARLGVCNNKLNYSRVQLVSLKKYATSFLPYLVITSLKQEGLLRNRGKEGGNCDICGGVFLLLLALEDLNMTTTTGRHLLMALVILTI